MTANPQGPVRVVPVEPTPEMKKAWDAARPATSVQSGDHEWTAPASDWFDARYAAMLAAAPSPAAPEGVEGWREIVEYSGCGPVLVSTAPDSPKYLASDPVTAFKDVGGTWRCHGSVGGNAPLALRPTHFAPMPKRPMLPPAPLADGGR